MKTRLRFRFHKLDSSEGISVVLWHLDKVEKELNKACHIWEIEVGKVVKESAPYCGIRQENQDCELLLSF